MIKKTTIVCNIFVLGEFEINDCLRKAANILFNYPTRTAYTKEYKDFVYKTLFIKDNLKEPIHTNGGVLLTIYLQQEVQDSNAFTKYFKGIPENTPDSIFSTYRIARMHTFVYGTGEHLDTREYALRNTVSVMPTISEVFCDNSLFCGMTEEGEIEFSTKIETFTEDKNKKWGAIYWLFTYYVFLKGRDYEKCYYKEIGNLILATNRKSLLQINESDIKATINYPKDKANLLTITKNSLLYSTTNGRSRFKLRKTLAWIIHQHKAHWMDPVQPQHVFLFEPETTWEKVRTPIEIRNNNLESRINYKRIVVPFKTDADINNFFKMLANLRLGISSTIAFDKERTLLSEAIHNFSHPEEVRAVKKYDVLSEWFHQTKRASNNNDLIEAFETRLRENQRKIAKDFKQLKQLQHIKGEKAPSVYFHPYPGARKKQYLNFGFFMKEIAGNRSSFATVISNVKVCDPRRSRNHADVQAEFFSTPVKDIIKNGVCKITFKRTDEKRKERLVL
jgi:hypothetical protein